MKVAVDDGDPWLKFRRLLAGGQEDGNFTSVDGFVRPFETAKYRMNFIG